MYGNKSCVILTLCIFHLQIDLCEMPNLIINRVVRREPVGLAYLKRFIMSMDSPTIALPALSSMTLNFDATISSSLSYDSQSSPAMATCTYMKSPDLKFKTKTSVTESEELFVSAVQTPEEMSNRDPSSRWPNTFNNLQMNTNNSCNHIEQSSNHVSQEQENGGPQFLTKSKKYINNLALASSQSESVNGGVTLSSTSSLNVTFTLSVGSEVSGVDNDVKRDNTTSPV